MLSKFPEYSFKVYFSSKKGKTIFFLSSNLAEQKADKSDLSLNPILWTFSSFLFTVFVGVFSSLKVLILEYFSYLSKLFGC